jgi:hypothetical protein
MDTKDTNTKNDKNDKNTENNKNGNDAEGDDHGGEVSNATQRGRTTRTEGAQISRNLVDTQGTMGATDTGFSPTLAPAWRAVVVLITLSSLVYMPTNPEGTRSFPGHDIMEDESREATLTRAEAALAALPTAQLRSLESFHAADLAQHRVVVAPAWHADLSLETDRDDWVPWDDLEGANAEAAGAAAFMMSALTTEPDPAARRSIPLDEVDWGPETVAAEDLIAYMKSVDEDQLNEKTLIAAFGRSSCPNVCDWAGRVGNSLAPSASSFPHSLKRSNPFQNHGSYKFMAFANRRTLQLSPRRPPPALDESPSSLRPRRLEDLLLPAAAERLQEWLRVEKNNLAAVKSSPQGQQMCRAPNMADANFETCIQPHGSIVIAQSEMIPAARGKIFDLRPWNRSKPGYVFEPSREQPRVIMNNDFIRSRYESSSTEAWVIRKHGRVVRTAIPSEQGAELREPDQELVGSLLDGLVFQADLPLQVQLHPFLRSLEGNYAKVDTALHKLVKSGVQECFESIPFFPWRNDPKGSATKKNSNAVRPTDDGGAPRRDLVDVDGVRAISLNAATDLKGYVDQERKHLKHPFIEIKPKLIDVMNDASVLGYAADIFGPLLGAVDDAKGFFNLIPVHPSEYWKLGNIWLNDEDAPNLMFTTTNRLNFGHSLNPNVAQRLADLMVEEFNERMDSLEDPLLRQIYDHEARIESPSRQQQGACYGDLRACDWLRARTILSESTGRPQRRLFAAHQYTDDIIILVLGQERLERALSCWQSVLDDLGIAPSPEKRMAGTRLTWLGFDLFLHNRVVALQPAKLHRALTTLDEAIAGRPVTFDTWRSFTGLLEHFAPMMSGIDRSNFMLLYGANFRRGQSAGPKTLMRFSEQLLAQCRRWRASLIMKPGSFMSDSRFSTIVEPSSPLGESALELIRREEFLAPQANSDVHLYVFSDAAAEESFEGLGGWLAGQYWHLEVPADLRGTLHITSLELLSLCIGVIIWAEDLSGHRFTLCSDALATVQNMWRNAARSPAMQAILLLLQNMPEFHILRPYFDVEHVFGPANIMADAASRAKLKLLSAVAAQLGVTARRIALPERALKFFSDACAAVRELGNDYAAPAAKKPRHAYSIGVDAISVDAPLPQRHQQRYRTTDLSPAPPNPVISWTEDRPRPTNFGPSYSSDDAGDGPHINARDGPSPGYPTVLAPEPLFRERVAASEPLPSSLPAVPPETLRTGPTTYARPLFRTKAPTAGGSAHPAPPRESSTLTAASSPLFRAPTDTCAPLAEQPSSTLGALSPPPSDYISSSTAMHDASVLDDASQLAVESLLLTIRDDTSSTAIAPTDPTLLQNLLAAVGLAVFSTVNVRTRKKDATAWRYWVEFTSELGTPTMRDASAAAFEVNVILFACFVFWLANMKMKPREKHRRLCKPSSILGNVYGVLRTLRYNGVRLDIMPRLSTVVTKLTDDFAMTYGYEALAPHQREPFTNAEVAGMLETPDGTTISSRLITTLEWSSWFGINLEAAVGISRDGGFRLAEWTNEIFHPMSMSRASLFFIINDVVHRCPSAEALASMTTGDLAGILVGPAKNDQYGLAFYNHPLYFRFRTGIRNTASALRNLERSCPCQPADRRRCPLLSRDSKFNPIPQRLARAALNTIMGHIPEAIRKHRSWHAFRVRLATLLQLAGAGESLILALLRWKSAKSLLIYARRNPQELATWSDRTLDHEVASVRGANLPSPLDNPMAAVPNSLTAASYEVLFNAQTGAVDDAAYFAASHAVDQLQLDGADFVAGLRQGIQLTAEHEEHDEPESAPADDGGALDYSSEHSDTDSEPGAPAVAALTPLQKLYAHVLSPAARAARDDGAP